MVRRRVAGHGPSPLIARPTSAPTQTRADTTARKADTREGRELVVARVIQETPDAVTIVMHAPPGDTFQFLPGQFFTLLTTIEGDVVTRNYSASNAPGGDELHLTIKKKVGGRVSGLLCSTQAGARLRVLGPYGSFVVEPAAHARRLVLVAGGAGITPLASIARTVLSREPSSEIAIVYANRREEDIILAAELDALTRAHEGRLTIVHVLEHVTATSRATVGRLDRCTATRALDALPLAAHPEAKFYVCGPDGMRDEVLAALAARGVRDEAVRIERFAIGPRPQVSTSSAAIAASVAPGARPVAIRLKGKTHRTTALPGATLLEAGLAAGALMPFSCGVGGCGACRVKVRSGNVEVEEPNCLSEAERAAGYVLACVGRPCGPCTIEVPEE